MESEKDTLHTNLCEWRKENQQLKDRIAELEKIGLNEKTTVGEYLREMERLKAELEKEQINNLNCDTELQYKDKKIAELEKENEILKGTKDRLTFADRVAIGNKALNEVKSVLLPKFAEKVKDLFVKDDEVREDIDETLKEFL